MLSGRAIRRHRLSEGSVELDRDLWERELDLAMEEWREAREVARLAWERVERVRETMIQASLASVGMGIHRGRRE